MRLAAEAVAEGHFDQPIPVDSSDELGQLARSFNEMQRRLARLDSSRKEFIANASHELRTPIFSLGGFVELLETEKLTAAERRAFVAEIRAQVERLQKLTIDLLDLSRLDADVMEIKREQVDLKDAARQVADEFRPTAELHESSLQVRGRRSGGRVRGSKPCLTNHSYPDRQCAHPHPAGDERDGDRRARDDTRRS